MKARYKGANYEETLRIRLLSGMKIDETSGCWVWQRSSRSTGHSTMTIKGKTESAYRISYETWVAKIPENMFVLHRCDNARCINPLHLEVGNQTKNMSDCAARGRSASGSKNGMSKLTLKEVEEIKKARLNGHTYREISKLYAVSEAQVSRICNGKSWKIKNDVGND